MDGNAQKTIVVQSLRDGIRDVYPIGYNGSRNRIREAHLLKDHLVIHTFRARPRRFSGPNQTPFLIPVLKLLVPGRRAEMFD